MSADFAWKSSRWGGIVFINAETIATLMLFVVWGTLFFSVSLLLVVFCFSVVGCFLFLCCSKIQRLVGVPSTAQRPQSVFFQFLCYCLFLLLFLLLLLLLFFIIVIVIVIVCWNSPTGEIVVNSAEAAATPLFYSDSQGMKALEERYLFFHYLSTINFQI